MIKLGDLSNDELLARLRAHLGRGNVWLAGLLAYLGEMDARRLYAEHACTSMWDFCVRKLGMSESEAQRRIAAARVLREFPLARAYLERGEIHLCAIYELHKHLTEDNQEELVREAAGKTTKAVAEMIAARFPKADVHPCIQPLAAQPALAIATTEPASPSGACSAAPSTPQMRPRVEPLSATRYRVELTVSRTTKDKLERVRDLMRHRNPAGDLEQIFDLCLDLLLTKLEKERLGRTARPKAKLRAVVSAVDGMESEQRDVVPSAPQRDTSRNDASTAQQRAASNSRNDASTAKQHVASNSRNDARISPLQLAAGLERGGLIGDPDAREPLEISGAHEEVEAMAPATSPASAERNTQTLAPLAASEAGAPTVVKPAPARKTARRSAIPRAVRREVCARDGEQCTYVDAEGNRCPARGFLELDHVEAKALGGSDEAANLRLRCRAHNRLHAEQVFGRDYVAERIHLRQRKYAAAHTEPPSVSLTRRLGEPDAWTDVCGLRSNLPRGGRKPAVEG